MAEPALRGLRILIVEDEYMLAEELRVELSDVGANVLGPVGTIEDAMALIGAEGTIDGAVLDVNLRGEWVYPAADLLARRAVPFVFATGYDATVIPPRFADVARCEKPVGIGRVARALANAMTRGGGVGLRTGEEAEATET